MASYGKYEIIKNGRNEYYFLLRAANGVVIAKSNIPRPTKSQCKNDIALMQKYAPTEVIEDWEES